MRSIINKEIAIQKRYEQIQNQIKEELENNQKDNKPELFTPVPGNRLNTGKPLIKMKNGLSPKR